MKNAMKLACKIGLKLLNDEKLDILLSDEQIIENTNICLSSKTEAQEDNDSQSFCQELKEYVQKNKELFKLQQSYDRNTRSNPFTPSEAKGAVDSYINLLWKCIWKRVKKTDLSNSPCAFSEAPAEGIFSVMERVKNGRESLTIDHLVALTRLAAHGPPASTEAAANLSQIALRKYKSQYGERFCTNLWVPGKTSKAISKLQSEQWDW